MIHKFVMELTDSVKGYEKEVERLEMIYGIEELEEKSGVWKQYKDSLYTGGGYTECSCCKMRYSFGGYHEVFEFKYCPECGAKMLKSA